MLPVISSAVAGAGPMPAPSWPLPRGPCAGSSAAAARSPAHARGAGGPAAARSGAFSTREPFT